jgi:hypothetical protein
MDLGRLTRPSEGVNSFMASGSTSWFSEMHHELASGTPEPNSEDDTTTLGPLVRCIAHMSLDEQISQSNCTLERATT